MNLLAWRRLIATTNGYLGTAVAAAEPPGRFCMMFGCNETLVLWLQGDGYHVILECYIQGTMRGEIVQDVKDRDFQV